MGTLSFEYIPEPKSTVSAKFFEFKRDAATEYSFDYERYAALSDASIFNAPVAIIKVATGVCLYDLFDSRVACSPNKKEHDTSWFKDQAFTIMREPIELLADQVLVKKKSRSVNEYIRKRLNRPTIIVNDLFQYDNLIYNNRKYEPNVLEQLFLQGFVPRINDYKFNAVQKPTIIKFYKNTVDESFRIDDIATFFDDYFINRLFGSNIVFYKEIFSNARFKDHVVFYTQEAIPKQEIITNTLSQEAIPERDKITIPFFQEVIPKQDNITNVFHQEIIPKPEIITILYSHDTLANPNNTVTIIYSREATFDLENTVRWYPYDVIPKSDIVVDASQDYFIEIDTNCTNAINTMLNTMDSIYDNNIANDSSNTLDGSIVRSSSAYNIYQTFPILRPDDAEANCFKEYLAWIYDYRITHITEILSTHSDYPRGSIIENVSASNTYPITGQAFEQILSWRKYKESLLGEQLTVFKEKNHSALYSPKDSLLFRYPKILNHFTIWPILGRKENKRSNPLNIYPIINTYIRVKEIIVGMFTSHAEVDQTRMAIFEDINVFKSKDEIIFSPLDIFLQRPEHSMGIILQEPIMASQEDKVICRNESFCILKHPAPVSILDLTDFTIHEERYMNCIETIFTLGDTKGIIEDNSLESIASNNGTISTLSEENLAAHNDKTAIVDQVDFLQDAKNTINDFPLELGAPSGKGIINNFSLGFGADKSNNAIEDARPHFGKDYNKNIYIDIRVQLAEDIGQYLNVEDAILANDPGQILFSETENVIPGRKDRNSGFVLENVQGYKDKINIIVVENVFGGKGKQDLTAFNDEFTFNSWKHIYVLPQDYDVMQNKKNIVYVEPLSGSKDRTGLFTQAQGSNVFKNDKEMSLYYQSALGPERITNLNMSEIELVDYLVHKGSYEIWLDKDLMNIILKRKKLYDLKFGTNLLKSKKPFSVIHQQMIYPEKKPLMQPEEDEFLSFDVSETGPSVTDREFSIFEELFMAFKTPYSIPWPNIGFDPVNKNQEMAIQDTSSSIYKEPKKLNIDITILWTIWKTQYDMALLETVGNVDKESHRMYLDNSQSLFEKTDDSKTLSIQNSLVGAIKTKYPLSVGYFVRDPYWSNYDGFIVALSKVRCNVTIDAINDFAKKLYRSTMISEQSFASVLAKPAGLENILELDQIPKDAFIDYENNMIIRSKLKSDMNQGAWTFKANHYVHIQYYIPWAEGHYRPVHIDNLDEVSGGDKKQFDTSIIASNIFGEQLLKEIFETGQDQAVKPFINTTIFNDLDSETATKEIHVGLFADEWAKMLPDHLDYYTYDTIGVTRDNFVHIEEIEPAIRTDKRGMLNFVDPVVRNDQHAWIEQGIFDVKLIKQAQLTYQLDWANRVMKKCDLHPDDFGNWAWVYETPDPFKFDKFGIDELLLPEKDTRYEHFEDMIFNKKIMRPINPIKNISDTEWIAALPIRHPVPNHSDVGRIYDASAVKWENYFGIHSSVIHDMSLKYYRIWEKHMYQFSTMTMQQSANQMLEYLWAWIPLYFPLELLEQAYRAFQLVRWYTESAIINNSHYRISFEYCDLKWPEGKDPGICTIPNDLKEYDPVSNYNDTMYSNLDPKALCLMANPIYCGSNPIWVEFSIDNKRNTTITFNLHNPIGYVNILLNGQVIDTITGIGTHRLVYNIRYTGLVNTFRIEKPVTSLLDKNFIIGNITVVMQSFKNLHIEFDPETRNGNKPLNEVAQKLIAFANLHDRKDVAYHEILSKNLAISEVYKSLVKYWEQHHEGKSKGKRLTIKQV